MHPCPTRSLSLPPPRILKVDGSALDLLKKKFPNESDVKLSRFLVARKHNLQAAIEMMMEDRSLRSSLGAIQPSDALPFLKADLFHFVGPALYAPSPLPLKDYGFRAAAAAFSRALSGPDGSSLSLSLRGPHGSSLSLSLCLNFLKRGRKSALEFGLLVCPWLSGAGS